MSFSIAGKTAIVTGAANGIGLAISREFAEQGANVMMVDMDDKQLSKEAGDVPEGSKIEFFAGDLRERLTIANLVSATIDAFDRVDILVNASRQMMRTDPLDMDDDSISIMLNQNLLTSLHLSQAVAKRMIKQADAEEQEGLAGSIVNMSSISACRTNPDLMGYSMATAALDQMTRGLATALAPHRIRVNAVAFGSVMSASLQNILKENPDYRGDIEAHTPLGRIAPPTELADTVRYLASDASAFMTGQIITVDGGRTLIDPVSSPAH
ncbi:SDR family NAD(P)-dependent oxidoreductase [Cognatishimia activa]|uniref:General stress protein 39 n=1 Tax=Cognatishimia activa TaxID=1715691 RepID=A0A0P1IR06_9RHOB|nr:SDR family oxidoreductase [Cognatishimia activa]MEE2944494.1 SDR family oxidoreductase [Pseudomonadota bacterium]CUJ05519.1 General stress protein 39 [Cognatishimia activa]CUK26039.1 General stress protein 39 [Cognatishimia activa]